MRTGIVSDTHGLLRREVIEGLQGVDRIIHAGDIDKKEVLNELEKIAPVTAMTLKEAYKLRHISKMRQKNLPRVISTLSSQR